MGAFRDKPNSDYEILAKIGQGGMGTVYKARDNKLGRLVALKFLSEDLSADRESREQFWREAQLLSRIDHPNICTIHAIDTTPFGQIYFVMPLYHGKTLRRILKDGPLPFEKAIDYALQITDGLHAAHQQNIIHTDIKPANLFVTETDTVKILDFGVARMRHDEAGGELIFGGTIPYMSPEQLRSETLGHRTDIWSLGVVVYEMFTGRCPFEAEFDDVVMKKILNDSLPPIAAQPVELNEMLDRMLEKNREKRIVQAGEVKTLLATLRKQSDPDIESDPDEQQDGRSEKASVRRRIDYAVFTIVLLSMAYILSVLLLRPPPMAEGIADGTVTVLLPENHISDSDSISEVIADRMINTLSNSSFLRVTPLEDILQLSAPSRPGDIRRVDSVNELNAAQRSRFLITSAFSRSGGSFKLSATVLDMKGTSMSQKPAVFYQFSDILPNVDFLAHSIQSDLASLLHVDIRTSSTGSPPDTSYQAYALYVSGKKARFSGADSLARTQFERAIAVDSTFALAYYELANVLRRLGNESLAKEMMTKASEHSVNADPVVRLKIEYGFSRIMRHYTRQREKLDSLATIQPQISEWHLQLGWFYINDLKRCPESIEQFEHAIRIEKGNPLYHYHLGFAHVSCGDKKSALEAFEESIRHSGHAPFYLNALAEALLLFGEYDSAEVQLAKSFQQDSMQFSTQKFRGDLEKMRGQYRDAEVSYHKSLARATSKADSSITFFSIAELHFLQSEWQTALAYTHKIPIGDVRYPSWLSGLIYLQMSEIDSANRCLQVLEQQLSAAGSDHDKEFLYLLKGKINLAENQPSLAIENLKTALKMLPLRRAYFTDALADAYLAAGDENSAIETYRRVFLINPNYAHSHYKLAKLYEEIARDRTRAKRHYRRFLEIWAQADTDLDIFRDAQRRLALIENLNE